MSDPITANDVAAYLGRHPRFLTQYPELAASLVLLREDGPATSLANYQIEILREKNRELTRRLHELFAVAQDNERLTVRTQQFTLALLRAPSRVATLQTAAAVLAEDFQGDVVRMVLHAPTAGLDDAGWLRTLPADAPALKPFAAFLAADEPLCGRLQGEKHALLFGEQAGAVQSTALLPLKGHGMLAIGSHDPNRFYPGMGTLFLRLMAESLVAALGRFEPA